MKRALFSLCSALSLLLCVAVCVLWVRGRTGYDMAEWRYDRYLADHSAASTTISLNSNKRLWLDVSWGQVGPYNGNLVWGYHINADKSGGHPRFNFRHERYYSMETWGLLKVNINFDDGTTGIGPLRWQNHSRSANGERFRYIRIGISHWLLALLLVVLPAFWLIRFRKTRREMRMGLCPACGYDLRATPERCPECGTIPSLSMNRTAYQRP